MSERFLTALTAALIRNPEVSRTNTPPDVLAVHMLHSLRLFESSLIQRSNHPFYAPGKPHAPRDTGPAACAIPDGGTDDGNLYRDRPGTCAVCEE